ncbi:TonB-dependent receptor domain-containing protein [Vibrio variabilis]|uniref:TonB-dependent receptor domain-containing protein n=1 Tax=Vibrio variabilis TaxID=990271 RepID=UPI000DD8AC16|nr:TonB-dependent receptor [Vibrio variabilis]
MNKSCLAIAVAASLSSYASFSLAQESSTATQTKETMVVTANRFEQPEDKVIAPMSVVTRQEIEVSQAKSLSDVLRRLPGVEVVQNGGRGQSTSIFLRGTNSNQTLVLVDGVRYSSDTTGLSINHFPIGLVEQVEVIRGPSAAIYGSDAIGGVINIITRTNNGQERKQINVGASSHDGREANFTAKTKLNENGHIQVAGGYEKTDGYDFKAVQDGTNYGYENRNLHLGYKHDFNSNWSALLDYRWFDSLTEYNSGGAKKNGVVDNQNLAGRIDYQSQAYKSFVTLSYAQVEKKDFLQSVGESNADTVVDTNALNAQWSNLYQINSHYSVGGGLDYRKEELADDAKSWGSAHKLAGESRENIGAYVSGRADYDKFSAEANVRHDRHDKYDNYTTWSLGGQYRFIPNYRAYAMAGTAFKAPSYNSLTTNPDLQPEDSRNLEVGLAGLSGFLDWKLSAYHNKVDNLNIWYSVPGDPWGKTYNVDADIKGVELEGRFSTGPVHHTVIAEYKDHKDDNGTQLARRAKENYKWIGEANIGDFDLSLTYLYTGKRLDLPTANPTADDYLPAASLWDAAVSYWVADNVALRARVDNLLDEEYETAKGYRSPGRTFFALATVNF